MSSVRLVVVVAVGMLAAGCGKEKPPVTPADTQVTASGTSKAQNDAIAKAATTNEGGGLSFSADVLRLCPGVRPPKFGFDSADLRGQWGDALSTLATCMKTGGLKDSALLLTGHTDPRGTDDYNMALGSRRADAVREAVTSFGVDVLRMSTTSRGKAEAKGTDEAGWAQDRRVDIGLRR